MSKIYVLIVVFLASGWVYDHLGKITLENDLNSLKKDYLNLEDKFEGTMQQKIFLEKEIEERNKKSLDTSERVCQIENAAKKEKSENGFDWDTSLPDDLVTMQLLSD